MISREELWGRALSEDRLAHAYLIVGQGVEYAAQELLLQLYCERRGGEGEVCRTCGPCQKLLHRTHPDVRWLEGSGSRIGIDPIRDLQKDARFRPLESQRKAYVIPEAERLTPEAANSLLKILEDPPEYVLFLLLAHGFRLLPTILSRCQIVRIRPFSAKELAEALTKQGYSREEVLYGVEVASGIPERRVQLCFEPSRLGEEPRQHRDTFLTEFVLGTLPESKGTQSLKLVEWFTQTEHIIEEHETAVELLQQLTSGTLKPHEVLELAAAFTKLSSAKAEIFLWEALCWMRDLLFLAQGVGAKEVFNMSRLKHLQAISSRWQTDSLLHVIQKLEKGMSALQANANAQLLWESLLFRLTPLP